MSRANRKKLGVPSVHLPKEAKENRCEVGRAGVPDLPDRERRNRSPPAVSYIETTIGLSITASGPLASEQW